MKIVITLPIKTVSEANSNEHWTKKAKRHKQQQYFVYLAYSSNVSIVQLPCTVTLTRLSPRMLDDDNLVSCFKYIRDEVGECIFPEKRKSYVTRKGYIRHIKGRADSDPRVTWKYSQEKNATQAIRIEIEW